MPLRVWFGRAIIGEKTAWIIAGPGVHRVRGADAGNGSRVHGMTETKGRRARLFKYWRSTRLSATLLGVNRRRVPGNGKSAPSRHADLALAPDWSIRCGTGFIASIRKDTIWSRDSRPLRCCRNGHCLRIDAVGRFLHLNGPPGGERRPYEHLAAAVGVTSRRHPPLPRPTPNEQGAQAPGNITGCGPVRRDDDWSRWGQWDGLPPAVGRAMGRASGALPKAATNRPASGNFSTTTSCDLRRRLA